MQLGTGEGVGGERDGRGQGSGDDGLRLLDWAQGCLSGVRTSWATGCAWDMAHLPAPPWARAAHLADPRLGPALQACGWLLTPRTCGASWRRWAAWTDCGWRSCCETRWWGRVEAAGRVAERDIGGADGWVGGSVPQLAKKRPLETYTYETYIQNSACGCACAHAHNTRPCPRPPPPDRAGAVAAAAAGAVCA